MRALFVSDCHLCPERPEANACFKRFLGGIARDADELYILGDLFHCWVGDDDDSPFHDEICAALRSLSRHTPIGFLRGNHDFMVGPDFERRTGCKVLPAKYRLTMGDRTLLLMHGDLLCTDDRSYQRYRRVIQNPVSRRLLMRLSLSARQRIAAWLMRGNRIFNQGKTEDIMDVNQDAVAACMREHNVRFLIHGHTHRRKEHVVNFNDGSTGRRIVLGSWGTGRADEGAMHVDAGSSAGNALLIESGETRWLDLA